MGQITQCPEGCVKELEFSSPSTGKLFKHSSKGRSGMIRLEDFRISLLWNMDGGAGMEVRKTSWEALAICDAKDNHSLN